ncbi:DUF5662 family protein [Microbispora sp. CA-102843]|uniref:DUF5662 family protein n=1 Tax=Microbispora sp. CA-102843 TaxID=3239952 RepID=UPI003D8F804D
MHDPAYDSRADTLKHSLRVGALMGMAISELVDRSVRHDLSKTEPPELGIFNEFTPKLKTSTYGSEEYKGFLEALGEGLQHHYAHNRHHPEHFPNGVNDMTLVDLVEMLADWKAATERHADGDLERSLEIQRDRFGMSDQLAAILRNTAAHFGWIPPTACGARGRASNGDRLVCNLLAGHGGPHADGLTDLLEFIGDGPADGEQTGAGRE